MSDQPPKMEYITDRISDLPDPIRTHIVSFLPMEDAFRTSILSSHWRDVCNSLPNLRFNQAHFESKPTNTLDFSDFVHKILRQHSESNIEKFDLTLNFDHSCTPHLHSWISFALRHNVKELKLRRLGVDKLPPPLFTSKTLTVLSLLGIHLDVPTVTQFPNLKRLYLEEVRFIDASHTNRLISSSPLIEDLTLDCCQWSTDSYILTISAPSLRVLKHVWNGPCPDVEISTTSLRQIEYVGDPPHITSETLSSLVKADISYFAYSLTSTKIPSNHMSNILVGLHNAVSLSLDSVCVEFLLMDPDLLSHLPTSCCSLVDLRLEMLATDTHVQLVTILLRSCPNLQTLVVSFCFDCESNYVLNMDGYCQSQEMSTEAIPKHLTTVQIELFEGSDCEFDLIKYLLEKSNVKKMFIGYSLRSEVDVTRRTRIGEKIAQFNNVSHSEINIVRFTPHEQS